MEQLLAAVLHLYYVCRLVSILFEDQHGRSIGVDVELFLQIGRLWQALVYVSKLQVILVGKGCELQGHNKVCVSDAVTVGVTQSTFIAQKT